MKTLLETIRDMSCVVLTTLPIKQMETIAGISGANLSDVKMYSFLVHNMMDNGLVDMTVELDNSTVSKHAEANGISLNSSVVSCRKAMEAIYEAEITSQV